jgi:hypothetical protein
VSLPTASNAAAAGAPQAIASASAQSAFQAWKVPRSGIQSVRFSPKPEKVMRWPRPSGIASDSQMSAAGLRP